MTEFLRVITADQLIQLLGKFNRLVAERVALDASLGRILSEDVAAGEDLPEGARSTVDGFAVRAEDTFGASDAIPAFLDVVAAVSMGTLPDFEIHAGQAAQIPTGGFLPRGADAVVMVEYANSTGNSSVEVTRPVTAKANVLEKGEDARRGDVLLPAGKELRPQELGFLAALGVVEVPVRRRPQVAILSTGDEIVPIERKPTPGQVRDANSHALAALVRSLGGEPFVVDIVPDNAESLNDAIRDGLERSDVVVISGGSSVGARDLIVDVVSTLPGVETLAHGVAIRPGKPALLADCAGKPVFGLPGHPVSALMVAEVFLAPFLRYIQGGEMEKGPLGRWEQATLATSFHSAIGLEEYVRVRIKEKEMKATSGAGETGAAAGGREAHPVFGKSGMLSTMVKADGVIRVPMNVEGLSKGDIVRVVRF
ncbi:MAG: molybdopterin molybdotransferase MoeA [Acidobacteriota bacterium]|nr:molybdopterin molybdotransferase MoeA [Acidobacteriota bacterium]